MAAEILRPMGLNSVVIVRDGYHIFRAKETLRASGLAVYGSARKERNTEPLHQQGTA